MKSAFVDPGAFRTELALEACTPVADGMGGYVEDWNEVATAFCLLEPVSATAVYGAEQTRETVTHRVTLRRRNDLASGMRFRLGDRLFDIVTVHDPDETGRYLVCRTREVGL